MVACTLRTLFSQDFEAVSVPMRRVQRPDASGSALSSCPALSQATLSRASRLEPRVSEDDSGDHIRAPRAEETQALVFRQVASRRRDWDPGRPSLLVFSRSPCPDRPIKAN